jgi:hypothetical protein
MKGPHRTVITVSGERRTGVIGNPVPVEELTELQAKSVGVLAGKSGHDDVVDVAIVKGAIRRSDAVVTSNPTHIRLVADATRTRLRIQTV